MLLVWTASEIWDSNMDTGAQVLSHVSSTTFSCVIYFKFKLLCLGDLENNDNPIFLWTDNVLEFWELLVT